MNVTIKATNLNTELTVDEKNPPQYMSEHDGIVFQTPYEGAELTFGNSNVSVQALDPNNDYFTFTNLFFEDKNLGVISLEKRFIGKDFKIKISEKNYKGTFTEENTTLILEN